MWQNNFVFDYIKQSYLIAAQNIQKLVADAHGLDPQTARKVRFFTRQFVDALAPTNFVFTNPEVMKRHRRKPAARIWWTGCTTCSAISSAAAVSLPSA